MRGAWVEIKNAAQTGKALMESLPVRGAWVEIIYMRRTKTQIESLPVRGAWVEIIAGTDGVYDITVAPRAGSVG